MADKTPTQGEQIAASDRTLYKEISPGVYARVHGAALMIGTEEVSVANPVPVSGAAGGGDVNIHDGVGNPLTSTVVGADQALDVNIVAGAGTGGTSSVDGAAFAPGVTALTMSGGEVDDVAPANVAEGASGAFRMSAERAIHTTLEDGAGNNRRQIVNAAGAAAVEFAGVTQPVGDGGGSLTTDFGGVAQPITDGGLSLTVDGTVTADIRDGAGVALTSTLVGADQSLDVNVVQTVGGAGGTSMVDDAAFTPGTTAITPAGAMFDDVAPDSVDEGDAGVVRMSANRNLYIVVRDGAGNERSLNVDALGSIGITNADLATLAGAVAGGQMQVDVVAALPAGANNIGDVDILSVPAPLNLTGGGVEASALRVTLANDSTGQVALSAAIPAGANNIGDVDIASLPNEGQQNMAASISVAIASDQSSVPVTPAAAEVLVKTGTQIRWEAAGGEYALTMASLAVGAARQGAKGDLGATRAARWRVLVENNMDAAPAAGDVLEYWWTSSPSGTAATTNTGACSGADAAYTGSAGGSVAETKGQLQYIGAMSLTPDADAVVQIKSFVFFPLDRYGSPVIINLADQILEGDDDAHRITLTPIVDEVQ